MKLHHINCGTLQVAGYPTVVCHCLVIESAAGLILVDTGIGLEDVRDPAGRLGQPLIDLAGFQFHEEDTAVRRIENLGLSPQDVRHIILTHGDPDHAGGLADFPDATVHVSQEELDQIQSGHFRYVTAHFAPPVRWQPHASEGHSWLGLETRQVAVAPDVEILLIPLSGHTSGHCGVAVRQADRWLLHVGDAYYLQAELFDHNHPVDAFASQRADHDKWRRASLNRLRDLIREHSDQVQMVGYHDITELPEEIRNSLPA